MPRIAIRTRGPSDGARALRTALGDVARIIRHPRTIPRQYRLVMNWGCSQPIVGDPFGRLLNNPVAIGVATNKLAAMIEMSNAGVPVPAFNTSPLQTTDDIWLARTVLRGSGGAGIVVVRPGETFPAAPLYTKYIRKTKEVRVHVFNGQAIYAQVKLRRNGIEQTRDQALLRNYDNGWVFGPRDLSEIPDATKAAGINAVSALNLNFGAVDIVLEKRTGNPYVLEVNTAPGLESPGVIEAYRAAIMRELT